MDEADLRDAGCAAELAKRCGELEAAGRTDECLQLLRRHRAELVVALHEAQRPIDVCDWIIHTLQKRSA